MLRGILDTSTVILLERIADPTSLPDESAITTITLAELSVGPLVTDDEREREIRQARLQQAEADFTPLPFDVDAARTFGFNKKFPIAELRQEPAPFRVRIGDAELTSASAKGRTVAKAS